MSLPAGLTLRLFSVPCGSYCGSTNHYVPLLLASTSSPAEAHSPITGALMMAQAVNDIAGFWHQLQHEMNDDEGTFDELV